MSAWFCSDFSVEGEKWKQTIEAKCYWFGELLMWKFLFEPSIVTTHTLCSPSSHAGSTLQPPCIAPIVLLWSYLIKEIFERCLWMAVPKGWILLSRKDSCALASMRASSEVGLCGECQAWEENKSLYCPLERTRAPAGPQLRPWAPSTTSGVLASGLLFIGLTVQVTQKIVKSERFKASQQEHLRSLWACQHHCSFPTSLCHSFSPTQHVPAILKSHTEGRECLFAWYLY